MKIFSNKPRIKELVSGVEQVPQGIYVGDPIKLNSRDLGKIISTLEEQKSHGIGFNLGTNGLIVYGQQMLDKPHGLQEIAAYPIGALVNGSRMGSSFGELYLVTLKTPEPTQPAGYKEYNLQEILRQYISNGSNGNHK